MASVEITDNTIIRSLVRKGTNDERKQISLAEGELGFTTDTKRLYIGDGSGIGNATGVKYLGTVNDFTTVASLNPMPGDYFKLGSGLYARKNGYQGSVSLENDNAAVEAGYDKIGLAANVGNGLILNNDNLNVNVDGVSILIDGNQLKVGEVLYDVLPDSSANSLLGNSSTNELPPDSISVNENSVLGRIASSNVNNVTFDQILSNAIDPTMSSLRLTGLVGSSTRPIFVSNTGQITTTAPYSQKYISCSQGSSGIFAMSNGYPPNVLSYNISNISAAIASGTSLDYLGFGYGFQLNVNYSICTVNIDNIRTVTGNTSLTWDEIDEFHFQFCSNNGETRCGFFGYRNQLSNQNVILDFDLRSNDDGRMDGRSNFGYHIIPNTGSDLQFHVGLRGNGGFQASLVSIKLK